MGRMGRDVESGGGKEGGGGQLGVMNVGLITSGETGEADDAVSKHSKDVTHETTTTTTQWSS